MSVRSGFDALFDPKGVLVAGVSTHPGKFGFVSLHNILASGYEGRVFGTSREALFAPENEAALTAIAKRLVDSVEVYEESARRGVDKLPFRSRLAVLSALRIYGAIGRRVGRLGRAAWDERVTVGKMQKLAYVVPSFAEAVVAGRR